MSLQFFIAPENLAFGVSLALVVLIGLAEGVGMLIGATFSSVADSLLPDLDIDSDFDLDSNIDGTHLLEAGAFTQFLNWMRVGQVPLMILVIIFLTSFGLGGYILQTIVRQLGGDMLSLPLASTISLFASLPVVRLSIGVISPLIPKDESSAVSRDSFIGKFATISSGRARKGLPAQAKVRDEHRRTHYIQVEPENPEESYEVGTEVELLVREKSIFKVKERR